MEEPKITTPVTPAANAVLMMIYVLYKDNMLTRRHLKDILRIIGEKWPDDLAVYLKEEAAKAA